MAYNVISCIEVVKITQTWKIADFYLDFGPSKSLFTMVAESRRRQFFQFSIGMFIYWVVQ